MNNRCLRYREVRLIASDGNQVGVVPTRQALEMAQAEGLDLVMVSANANPPVCRIIDHGKFRYEQDKREKESKRKQQDVKGIKISPRIAEHDMEHLTRNAQRFLEEGHKVKITCQFRAREVTHPELGRKKLEKMAENLAEWSNVERDPTMDGRLMIMVLTPKPQGKKNAKAEDKQDGGKKVQDHREGSDNAKEGL
ncbi:MAG: translation initiation factor IF-3 [Fimbriimonadaceae bacterium]